MNFLHRLEHWGDHHHPRWLDLLRMALGAFLCYKGIDFLQNMSALVGFMSIRPGFNSFATILVGHFIAFAHLLGGFLITIGLFTRIACAVQIPILLGAVVFNSYAEDILKPYSEWIISITVLLLLIGFLILGNGPWSFRIKEEERDQYK